MSAYGTWIANGLAAQLSGHTVKAMLVTDAYAPNPDSTSAPSASEVSGTGYTAGGVDVTSLVSITYDSANDRVVMSLSGLVDFGAIVVTGIGGIVFYISGGQPLCVDMFGSTDWAGGSNFTYEQGVDGLQVIEVGT